MVSLGQSALEAVGGESNSMDGWGIKTVSETAAPTATSTLMPLKLRIDALPQ